MTRVIALSGAIAVVLYTAAAAQGLADAAQRAKDQSDAVSTSGKQTTNLSPSPADSDLQEVPLTHDVVDQYAQTRLAVEHAFARDNALYHRVDERVRKVSRARHAADIYAIEPALKKAIEFNGFTVAGFMDVVLTMQRANVRAHADKIGALSSVQVANTTFMRENVVQLRALEAELGSKDAWLLPVPSYFVRY